LRFALYDLPDGAPPGAGLRVVYDIGRGEARLGGAASEGHALVWALGEAGDMGAPVLSVEVDLDSALDWVIRCDRIDFPPGGVAYRHVHPGPGIRRLLFGELTIDAPGHVRTYGPGEAWFEAAEYPVLATASARKETAFVRVLLLPAAWAGRRTIRYLDPADDEKPKLQRAAIVLEERMLP
jgi:hypothetical protein